MIGRNDPCWCGSGNKWKKCHFPLENSSESGALAQKYFKTYGIVLKNTKQIEGIKKACRLTAQILKATCSMAKEGITTNELNTFAEKLHAEAGAKAAPLGYGSPPFPKSICTSLNEVICHGIPNDVPLQNGDFLNIDVSCILNGFFGDCSAMVAIGEVSEEKKRVMDVSLECLTRSIAILRPGLLICEIGKTIEDYATAHQCSVVNQFVGHGVGLAFHEPPEIPHHYNQNKTPLAPGMIFTIEPMINAGVRSGHVDAKDQWTVRTDDSRPSAQWEHTVLITEDGYEILTKQ